jgi:hypothetical protein
VRNHDQRAGVTLQPIFQPDDGIQIEASDIGLARPHDLAVVRTGHRELVDAGQVLRRELMQHTDVRGAAVVRPPQGWSNRLLLLYSIIRIIALRLLLVTE